MANEQDNLAQAPVGFGLASMAKNTIALRKQYTQYRIDTMEAGQEPMSFEEWARSQGA